VFSAQQYVENYLKPPFEEAGYANLNFIDVSLCGVSALQSRQFCSKLAARRPSLAPFRLHTKLMDVRVRDNSTPPLLPRH
jgi:hypothetical protein